MSRRRAAPRWGLAATLLAAFGPGLVLALVLGDHLAGGDSGQWVMLARAYAGLPIPAYRDAFAVPPAAPLLVLGFLLPTGDPFLAPKLALLVAFALVTASAFALGRALFGWLPGLAASVLVAAGQHFYLRLAVFGALPQLLALAAFGATLAALARWSRAPTRANAALVSLGCLAVLASHVPTAAVALPVVGLAALLVPAPALARPGEGGLRGAAAQFLRRAAPFVPAAAGGLAYAWLERSAFESYVNNEAAFQYKGLGSAVAEMLRFSPASLFLLVGAGVLAVVALRGVMALSPRAWARFPLRELQLLSRRQRVIATDARREALRAAVVLSVPVFGLGALMLGLYAARIGTDYPRIFPLLGFPALVSLGALVPAWGWREVRSARAGRAVPALGLAALLVLPMAGDVVLAEQQAVPYYSLDAPQDLRAALAQVNLRVPQDQTVWTPVREGKWLEGATGRAALFALPAWAIFRPWEWARKTAAETLASGSAWLGSGLVGALFAQPSVSADNPTLKAYYKGDLQPVLRVDDANSTVALASSRGAAAAPVALASRSETLAVQDGAATLVQRASGAVGGHDVTVVRTAVLAGGSPGLTLSFDVRTDGAPLAAVAFALRLAGGGPGTLAPGDGGGLRAVSLRNAEPLALGLEADGGARLSIASGGDAGWLSLPVEDGPAGPRTEARGTLHVLAEPVGDPRPTLEALTAPQALDAYRVGWALLPNDDPTLRAAAGALGFHPVFHDPTYTLYERGASA